MKFYNEKIAIVGIGIIAPKAFNKDEFWNNIITKKNCIIEVPKDRWDWRLYYDPDPKAKDKTYSKIGGFIENFNFDSIKYKIPPIATEQISRLQKLTIEATKMALDDCGYTPDKWDPKRVGVIIANAMGAMRKEFTDLRVYKFLMEDMISKIDFFSKLSDDEKKRFIQEYEKQIDEYIINITEDTMPGELANVTSGRIANVFDFNGPNLITDAACASSLAALDYAVMALRTGKVDICISGGADEMMSPAAYVKFCKIGALSPDGSFPFDARANGFVMGEAVGIYVLKRLSDAVRDGDKIYAVINSIGASSDGKGKGITAPNPKGQKLAIENAFKEVDYKPSDVDLIECHGTATRVGDATECSVLKEFFSPYLGTKKLKVTSIKSQIGHTKAAAGAISIIKVALSLYKKIFPPSINFEIPNPNIDFSVIEVVTEPIEWKTNGIRRANVSSFGFGGTNFHCAMEEYVEGKTKYSVNSAFEKIEIEKEKKEINIMKNEIKEDTKAPFSLLSGETFAIGASNLYELKEKLEELKNKASTWGDLYPQTIVSVEMNKKISGDFGIAIVSKSPKDLIEKIDFINNNFNEKIFDDAGINFKLKGIYPFRKKINYKGKIGFVFPGQGSQYVDMMRDLAAKYDVVMDTFKEADRIMEKMIGVKITDTLWSKPGETKEELLKREEAIKQTQMTQPSVMTADMAMFRLLASFGIKPDMVIGHSLGEYAAATAAGIFTLENGLRAVTSRAKEMSNIKVKDPGKMASVAWPYDKVEEQLKKIKGYVVAANKNCPIQTVIAGEKGAVDEAIKLFKALGVEAQEIAVSHAFHSEIIRPAIEPYREFLKKIPIKSWDIPIISNVTADFFPKDTEAIYDLLVRQMVSPVEFINQIKKMYDEGVRIFIECGPKRVLSAFVTETLKDKNDIFVLSTNHPKRGGIYDFNDAIANLITVNFDLKWDDKLIERSSKFYNPYYLKWAVSYLDENNSDDSEVVSNNVEVKMNETSHFVKEYGFNFNPIVISGIAAGSPSSTKALFRERALDEILDGENMIEPIPMAWREKQIDKNIIRVIKSDTGDHKIEAIKSVDDAIKLSARAGFFDIVKDFGVPEKIAEALNSTFRMAIASGILALKDAHIPLIHYYKRTTTGGFLPEKWALPKEIADETGVIFASAFPTMESIIKEVSAYFMDKYGSVSEDRLWEIYENIIDKLKNEEDKKELRKWMRENLSKFSSTPSGRYQFSQNFLLKVIPIADSQFAQLVGAKGPAIHLSAACASTTQAVHVAESWIRSGKCKRVVVIAADDITNEILQEWTMPGFLAAGTATTKEDVREAALPFDRRRHGLIVGSGAVALVIEDETLVRERGVVPLARLLLTEAANSAYHVTRLDTDHVAEVMERFINKIEKIYGLKKEEIAPKTLFVSHETYTPRRGGSASAEVKALKKAFGEHYSKIVVSNVKGFTGHTMGASLEDAIAVRALNTGIIPPIANYKEPDPELEGINLSKGGKYDLKYAIRFAAGFGSHMGMSFIEKVYTEGEKRIFDEKKFKDFLKRISGYDDPELEVVNNTLRIKDKGPIQQQEKISEVETKEKESKEVIMEKKEEKINIAEPQNKEISLTEESVTKTIVNMISEKTGYPKDMLDLDLDMEADLGIDTVKQAELFGMIREYYGIPRQENLSLKDYPTIRHCIRFVLENKGAKSDVKVEKKVESVVVEENKNVSGTEAKVETTPKTESKTELDEKEVTETIVNMISEKTGYPKDMLDLDLDMEADLGIDTVKQAELFGMIREYYGIPRQENLSLKDYPTIRHCIRFVLENKGAKSDVKVEKKVESVVVEEDKKVSDTGAKVEITPKTETKTELDEKEVTETIVNMISEKTGYPKDMLDLDLDMEADLGIDTVKQAELFGMIREYYGIPRQENLSLKDYPTIRHCIRFVLENKSKSLENKSQSSGVLSSNVSVSEKDSFSKTEVGEKEKKEEFKVDIGSVLSQIENKHTRNIRYIPTIVESKVIDETIRKFDPSKPSVIIGENIELIKLFRNELSKLGISSIVITSSDTKMKDTHIVDFSNTEEYTKLIQELAKKDIGGIVYLMGCFDKKFDSSTVPKKDVTYYVLPLFIAAKYFGKSINSVSKDYSKFILIVTTLDGGFGYITKETYDPIYAGIFGVGLCLRKENENAIVKVIDFPKNADIVYIVKKSFYEIQYSDKRAAVSYDRDGKRYTLVGKPSELKKEKEKENFTLKGKKVIITGGGRGLGSLFARIASYRWKPEIIIIDIIELMDDAYKFANMSEKELEDYKKVIMQELKKTNQKVTPVMVEKEFIRIKDSATLYKTIKEIESLGAKVYYYKCDLNNEEQFSSVIEDIINKFGKVDGIVHFAGLERSKLAIDKDVSEFLLVFNTKANSAVNFYKKNIINDDGLWVMVSSIAGKFGNLGQTDYASASDYISKFAINLFNMGRKAFAIDMTAIANIGMGIRPGVKAFLVSQEVEFLYPEEVMNTLADEISFGENPEIIYSGSLGKLDWDKQLVKEEKKSEEGQLSDKKKASERIKLHFIDKLKNIDKNSFSAQKTLDIETDNYLVDHSINETPVFPGVMGLEAFAQILYNFTGELPKKLANIEFKLPIKLYKNRPLDINLLAEKSDRVISMMIKSDFINPKGIKVGETRMHFTARYVDDDVKFSDILLPKKKEKYKATKDDIYKIYFHGPSFQVLDGIIESNRDFVIGVFKKPSKRLTKTGDFRYIFHPMIIEAVFQTCGWRDLDIDNRMTLPHSIGEVKIIDNNEDPDKLYTYSVFKGFNEFGRSVYDGYAFDDEGRIWVELKNYVMIPMNII